MFYLNHLKNYLNILKKKALTITDFSLFIAHTTRLFKNFSILKLFDIVNVEFVYLWTSIYLWIPFQFSPKILNYPESHTHTKHGLLYVSNYNWIKSIIRPTNLKWNYLHNKLTEYDFLSLAPKSLKMLSWNSLILLKMITGGKTEGIFLVYTVKRSNASFRK